MARRRARSKGTADTGPPSRVAWVLGVLVLRLWTGAFFLVTALWKLTQEGYSLGERIADFQHGDYTQVIQGAIAHPPVVLGVRLDAYAAFLRDVMLPLAPVAAPAILFFELLLGLGLVLGLGVRLLAALGFLLMLAFDLAKAQPDAAFTDPRGLYLFTVKSANWPVTWILLALALFAAGRVVGLDRLLRARGPRWLRWVG